MVFVIVVNEKTPMSSDIGKSLDFEYYKYTNCWVRQYETLDEAKGMCKVLCGLGFCWFIEDESGDLIYDIEDCEEDMLLSVVTAEAVNT